MSTDKKLKKLRQQLQGHYSEIAKAENVNVSTISRILNGTRNNDDLLVRIINHRDRIIGKKEAIYSQI